MFAHHQMPVLEIVVNGIPVQPGEPVGVVKSLVVNHQGQLQVHPGQGRPIADWLWNIVQKCESEHITYNGVIILKSEVTQYQGR